MAHRIVFAGMGEVELESFEPSALEAGQVRIDVHFSLISTGTETIVLYRQFDEGTPWDRWVRYPFYPGYASVGVVTEVAADVESVRVGESVAVRSSHASEAVVPAEACIPIPEAVSFEDAAWFALAKIAAMGARRAQFQLGDSVVIVGAGPVGQMILRWARAAGVETLAVVDPFEARLAFAERGGATATFAQPIHTCSDEVKVIHYGEAPRVVIDTTGNSAVFACALDCVRPFGMLLLIGDTGTPTKQHLTSDIVSKGVTVVGSHDSHETPEWNDRIISRLFFHLVQTGRFPLEGLNTHTFAPEDCAEAYELASSRRNDTMGMLFDWRKL